MTLSEFDRELQRWMYDPCLRPFVCRGSPLDCRLFIVGINPGTLLPFAPYWDPANGFDKTKFLNDYCEKKGLASGQFVGARRVIEWIVDAAEQPNTLDTNIYAYPTERKKQLKREHRITTIFEFLMHSLQRKVVFAYSREPIEFFGVDFDSVKDGEIFFQPKTIWEGEQFDLFCWCKHLKSTSRKEAGEIGNALAHALLSEGRR